MRNLVILISFLAVLAACSDNNKKATVENVFLQTDDGIRLGATVYIPRAAEQPNGVVLVHRFGGNRTVWEGFARAAQQAGMLAAAVDLRGHGESREADSTPAHYSSLSEEDIVDTLLDIEAAKNYLLAQGAHPENLAVIGEGLGANLALRYTVQSPDIQAVVMISPGLEYNGIETGNAISQLVDCPALLIACEGDAYSAMSATALKQSAPVFAELRSWPGASHGVDLFTTHPESMHYVLDWLKRVLDMD